MFVIIIDYIFSIHNHMQTPTPLDSTDDIVFVNEK